MKTQTKNVAVSKKLGQYMTPNRIVNMILDNIGYSGLNILKNSIVEPSFGNGVFLINIATRLISECQKQNLDGKAISDILHNNIYGIEKDSKLYNQAIERLNTLCNSYDIPIKSWDNLINGDTLLEYRKFIRKIDYCVGNPPFIRIHNIPEDYRECVKEFTFANGMIDLYIIFYEIGLYMLNETGKLGYISPNSFMKNISHASFRQYLIDNKYISALYDFKNSKLFPDADTYTCICFLNKNKKREDFSVNYREYQMYEMTTENIFSYEYFSTTLKNKAWNLSSKDDIRFLTENHTLPIKLNDISIIQNGVATNKDSIYIVKVYEDSNLLVPYIRKHTVHQTIVYIKTEIGPIPIESAILHRCVKASKFSGNIDNTYILFPYKPIKSQKIFDMNGSPIINRYEAMTEFELSNTFPLAYHYLLSVRNELSIRNMEKKSAWFLFARSQGLTNSCFKKIVFKHIIDKTHPIIKPYILDEDVVVYSGIYTTININNCITPKLTTYDNHENNKYIFNNQSYEDTLKKICTIFASTKFARYCSLIGKDVAGGYVSISTKMMKEFGIPLTTFY